MFKTKILANDRKMHKNSLLKATVGKCLLTEQMANIEVQVILEVFNKPK